MATDKSKNKEEKKGLKSEAVSTSSVKSNKLNKSDKSDKSMAELVGMLEDYTKELMNLRVQKAVGQLTAPHRVRVARRNIARVKTLIHLTKMSKVAG